MLNMMSRKGVSLCELRFCRELKHQRKNSMKNRSLLALVACGALNLSAQTPARIMEQMPGSMTSWAGRSGTQDHSETRKLPQGTALACEADNAPGSTLSPGCYVIVEGGGHYALRPNYTVRLAKDGVATLTCNGPSPSWCRVQVAEDNSPLKPGDTKAHKQNSELSKK